MQYAARETEKRMRLEQQERRREAELQRQNQHLQGDRSHRVDAPKSGRTIIESLDETVPSGMVAEDGVQLATEDGSRVGEDKDSVKNAIGAVVVKRRRKRRVIRKWRPRRYSTVRRRRRKLEPNWNSGFRGGKSRKVRSGYRPRRR